MWIFSVLAALLPPAALVSWLFRLVSRPDLRCDARTRLVGPRKRHYSFALFNGEDAALRGALVVTIEPLVDGRPMAEPILLCGPSTGKLATCWRPSSSDPSQTNAPGPSTGGTFVITASSIRAFSTWVVLCETDGSEGDLRMTVTFEGEQVCSLRGQEPADRREPRMAITVFVATVLGLLTYGGGTWVLSTLQVSPLFLAALDPWLGAALVLLAAVCFGFTRRVTPRPVIGYTGWDHPGFRFPRPRPQPSGAGGLDSPPSAGG